VETEEHVKLDRLDADVARPTSIDPTPSRSEGGFVTHQPTIDSGAAQSDMVVRPLRHPWRLASAVLVVILFVLLAVSLATNHNMNWGTVGDYLFSGTVMSGIVVTLYLTVLSMVVGIVGAVVVALMRLSENRVLSSVANLFLAFFRGTPVLVQLIFWGYLGFLYSRLTLGVPFTDMHLFSVDTNKVMTPIVAATLALGLNEAAYSSEIIRGGILSISRGQTDAAYSLGLTPRTTMFRIILPQAMRVIIPPMGNEVITMLKLTSLVTIIGGGDLMTNIQHVYAENFQVIPLLTVAAIWYIVLVTVLSVPQAWLERRYGRGHGDRTVARRGTLRLDRLRPRARGAMEVAR